MKQSVSSISAMLAAMALIVMPALHADNANDLQQWMQQLTKTTDPQDLTNAEIDFEYDAANCAAFYNMESALAKQSGYGDTDAGRKMNQLAIAAMQLAVVVSKGIGMSDKALTVQVETDATNLIKQLGKNYVNTPLVVQNVGLPCKEMLEHPMSRMAHWLKVERDRSKHAS